MNCPYCDKEILDEEATFCPKCGKSLAPECELEQNSVDVPQKRSDLVLAAAILSIVAAAFSAGLGYVAIYQYMSLIPYSAYYSDDVLQGFLILGAQGIVASAFAIAGGNVHAKKKIPQNFNARCYSSSGFGIWHLHHHSTLPIRLYGDRVAFRNINTHILNPERNITVDIKG